jgi:hypothetical protein
MNVGRSDSPEYAGRRDVRFGTAYRGLNYCIGTFVGMIDACWVDS